MITIWYLVLISYVYNLWTRRLLILQIFDDRLILPLISTLQELFERFHGMKGLIAATVRNTTTLDGFLRSCGMNEFFPPGSD